MTEIATLATTFVMLVCGEKRSRLPRLPRVPHEEIRCWENLGTKRLALPTFIMLVDSGLVRKNCVRTAFSARLATMNLSLKY